MNNIIALQECPGCGVVLVLTPEIEQVDFSGSSFYKKDKNKDV